jgi:hypothetical protein
MKGELAPEGGIYILIGCIGITPYIVFMIVAQMKFRTYEILARMKYIK